MSHVLPDRYVGSPIDLMPDAAAYRAQLEEHVRDRLQLEPASFVDDGPTHVLVDGRQTGKTHASMEWVLSAPDGVERALIVPTFAIAAHLRDTYGLKPADARVVHVSKLQREGALPGVEYGIDETVDVLVRLLGLREVPRLLSVQTAAAWQRTSG